MMLPVKKKIDSNGRVSIGEVLEVVKIKPGDWVEVVPGNNKVTIKISKRAKPKGAVKAAAGILKDNHDLVDMMLRVREF
ncbi:MAG: AbrB/MazE/SpoVT family DNA-binding domain-containing protein [Bacillota bacterium]